MSTTYLVKIDIELLERSKEKSIKVQGALYNVVEDPEMPAFAHIDKFLLLGAYDDRTIYWHGIAKCPQSNIDTLKYRLKKMAQNHHKVLETIRITVLDLEDEGEEETIFDTNQEDDNLEIEASGPGWTIKKSKENKESTEKKEKEER